MKRPTPGQILNQLLEADASPVDRAMRIRALEQSCTDGFVTETNTARGDIVEVRIVEPKTALACNRALGEIFERYEDMTMLETEGDHSLHITISNLLPTDAPAVTE